MGEELADADVMKDGDWLSGGVFLRKCEETEFKITDFVDEERVQDALAQSVMTA